MKRDQYKLWQKIHEEIGEMFYYQKGLFPTALEREKLEDYWVRFFGFRTLAEMTIEDLTNFIGLLQAKIRAEKKVNCFPEFHNFLGCGSGKEGESIYYYKL